MATVWILENGPPSDRTLIGVYSTQANALRAKSERSDREDHDPTERILDENMDWVVGPGFSATISKADGVVSSWEWAYPVLRHPSECRVTRYATYIFVTSPLSIEHARKVADDERQEWLRRQR